MVSAADKASVRARIRAERAAESPLQVRDRAAALHTCAPQITALAQLQEPPPQGTHRNDLRPSADPPAVAGFLPTNGEPDVTALLSRLARSVAVLLPRVLPESQLGWAWANQTDLIAPLVPRIGIPRPSGDVVAVGADLLDLGVRVMLVPALAVDPDTGGRLGYGAGYYDRLLSRVTAPLILIGVTREADLLSVPVEAHDRPVSHVLTESGLRPITARQLRPHGGR